MTEQNCPICGQVLTEAATSTAAFCSERCRDIDLGRWLGERYRIVAEATPDLTATVTDAVARSADDTSPISELPDTPPSL